MKTFKVIIDNVPMFQITVTPDSTISDMIQTVSDYMNNVLHKHVDKYVADIFSSDGQLLPFVDNGTLSDVWSEINDGTIVLRRKNGNNIGKDKTYVGALSPQESERLGHLMERRGNLNTPEELFRYGLTGNNTLSIREAFSRGVDLTQINLPEHLNIAIGNGNLNLVMFIIGLGANVDRENILHAARSRKIHILNYLLQTYPQFNTSEFLQEIREAYGSDEILELLNLPAGKTINPYVLIREELNKYFVNSRRHSENVLAFMRETGITVDQMVLKLFEPGFIAGNDINRRDRTIANTLAKLRNIGQINPETLTQAMILASIAGYHRVILALLSVGVDVNIHDGYPLRVAVAKQNHRLVRQLLGAGADPTLVDNEALMIAADYGNQAMVELLLEYGADPNARGGEAFGRAEKYPNIQALLR